MNVNVNYTTGDGYYLSWGNATLKQYRWVVGGIGSFRVFRNVYKIFMQI